MCTRKDLRRYVFSRDIEDVQDAPYAIIYQYLDQLVSFCQEFVTEWCHFTEPNNLPRSTIIYIILVLLKLLVLIFNKTISLPRTTTINLCCTKSYITFCWLSFLIFIFLLFRNRHTEKENRQRTTPIEGSRCSCFSPHLSPYCLGLLFLDRPGVWTWSWQTILPFSWRIKMSDFLCSSSSR